MRYNIVKKNSTKSERRVYEVLKRLKVPFKHRVKIVGRECDFQIGNYILEIDGHDQFFGKNERLVALGFIPVHLSNKETRDEKLITNLIKKCL